MPWVETDVAALRYALSGEGPPIVLLHEMGGCLESWDSVVTLLPGRTVLRYDQRGAGLSQKIVGDLHIEDSVADLSALLDAVGLTGRVALAGCAVGAGVALAFAARNPARVASVVAMAPATGLAPDKRAVVYELAEQTRREGVRPRVLARLGETFPPQYRTDPARFSAFRSINLANDPASYAATYRMLAGLDLTQDLPRITCPCLVLGGETDATRPRPLVEAVAAAIPGAQFAMVASGHVMPMLTPDLVARIIMEFPDKTPKATQ